MPNLSGNKTLKTGAEGAGLSLFWWLSRVKLNDARFLQSLLSTVLLDVAKAFSRYNDLNRLSGFRNEDAALLQICLAAYFAGWVELRSAGTVRVPAAYLRGFSCNCAFACHSRCMVPYANDYATRP